MARVLLGVGGGIAAYKSVLLARMLAETGHQVRVIPTRAGLKFVGAATFEAITGEPAIAEIFEGSGTEHIELAGDADVIIVAPATANLMARIAAGMADDLLTAVVLATSAPVWMAPAMHTGMWLNPATQANVATLRARGVQFIGPAEGRLAGSDSGLGRMSEPETIRAAVFDAHDDAPLAGTSALVTAGGTREAVDPVRFLGNASSGLQGIEIARALQRAGAQVTLIAANTELPSPPGVERITVTSAEEMRAA
ncbi:MAG: bifunctional phosphopantothenoylcysteine decarboxylase/phosphopantothenate--cysteine ligase CoaBC, partial [Micrococcales bacterium]|nr:bifunctional phosphopantothenoylcysteine decarboxylase/phosphopantothenate--cysteine ligase CoaBC [Micrococcales bacterium]